MTETATIEDLARAADDAGASLVDEVNTLADRLTPRRMVDEALSVVRARGTDLARDAGNVVKAHPVVTGAAVAAIGLALYAGNRISKAEIDLGHDLDDYSDYDDSALNVAAAAAATGSEVVDDAREMVQDNPVIAILAGIAAGAALALLFPTSSAEKRSVGALARRLTSR